ncbi:hypothetical protein ACE6H2_005054 [Prunus campanulata]
MEDCNLMTLKQRSCIDVDTNCIHLRGHITFQVGGNRRNMGEVDWKIGGCWVTSP